jgi:aryl-alcohol dehydrogenase-like predicted oxidoreductase
MEALHDLVRSGKIRYIGASSMRTYQFAMMQFCAEKHGWTKFVSMQNQYSLTYREEEREMNRFCNETGVGLIPVRFMLIERFLDRVLMIVFIVEPTRCWSTCTTTAAGRGN